MDVLQLVPLDLPLTAAAFVPALWLACLLDLLFGDPRSLPHPVMLIARIATALESLFRKNISSLERAGRFTVIGTFFLCGLGTLLLFVFCYFLSPWLLFAGSVFLLYTTFALRSLSSHAMAVYHSLCGGLSTGDLQPARESVGLIVGRDTSQLDYAGIIRACVESVAENMSDGVIAPLFYSVLAALLCLITGLGEFSVPAATIAALLYKAVNTMDSIFGYKNERYLYFGRSAALLDDVVNCIPARLSAIALVVVALVTGRNGLSAWKILWRDGKRHASPNAGYPEAAMAGALGLQLGGSNRYFGKIMEKPTIGDALYTPDKEHVKDAIWLMISSSLLLMLVFSMLYIATLWLTG